MTVPDGPDGWRKSSRSQANSDCVEVNTARGSTARVRDSKDPDGGQLAVTAAAWTAFTVALKR